MAMQISSAGQVTNTVTPSSNKQQLQWLPVLGRQVYCPWPETATTPAVPSQQSMSQTDACCRVVAQDVENFGQALQTSNLKRSVHDFMIFHLRQAFCITTDDHLQHMTTRGRSLNNSTPVAEKRDEWCALDLWVRERVLAFDTVGYQKLISLSVATAQMQWWIDDCESLRIKISMNQQWIAVVQGCQAFMPPRCPPHGTTHSPSDAVTLSISAATQALVAPAGESQSQSNQQPQVGPNAPSGPSPKEPPQSKHPVRVPLQNISGNVRAAAACQNLAPSSKPDDLENRIALLCEKRKHEDQVIQPSVKRHKSASSKSRPSLVPTAPPRRPPTPQTAQSAPARNLVINHKAIRAAAESAWIRTAPVLRKDGKPNQVYHDREIHFHGIPDLDRRPNGTGGAGYGCTTTEACIKLGLPPDAFDTLGLEDDVLYKVEASDPAWLQAQAWYHDSANTDHLPSAWAHPGPHRQIYIDSANAQFDISCGRRSSASAAVIDLTDESLERHMPTKVAKPANMGSTDLGQRPLFKALHVAAWQRIAAHDTAKLMLESRANPHDVQDLIPAVLKSLKISLEVDWPLALDDGAKALIDAAKGKINTNGWGKEELKLRKRMQIQDELTLSDIIEEDPSLTRVTSTQALEIHTKRADLNAREMKGLKARKGRHEIEPQLIAVLRALLRSLSKIKANRRQFDDCTQLVPHAKLIVQVDPFDASKGTFFSSGASANTTSVVGSRCETQEVQKSPPVRTAQRFCLTGGVELETGAIDLTNSPPAPNTAAALPPWSTEPPPLSQPIFTNPPSNYQPPCTEPLLYDEQAKVVDLILQGANVFYTGSAGCGKSTVLKSFVPQLRDLGKTVRIVAPTGRAALDVNGSTTWTFAGWTPDHMKKPIKELEKNAHGKFVSKRLRETDVLVIDEISMLENHHFERLNRIMKSARNRDKAFGGAQVIVTGDFCQLPPVKPFQYCITCGREQSQRVIDGRTVHRCSVHGDCDDDDKWAFRSGAWKECNFQHVNLSKIHRQSDKVFIKVLQKLRIGTPLTSVDRNLLLNHPCSVTDAVRLFPTREEVKRVNQTEFDKLKTAKHTYTCLDLFNWNEEKHPHLKWKATRNKFDNSLLELREHRLESSVEYKQGMLVVLLVNLDISAGLVNGSQGRIVGFEDYDPAELPKAPSRSGPGVGSGRRRGSNDFSLDSKSELRGEHAGIREGQIRHFISHPRNKSKLWPIVKFDNGLKRTIFADCQVNELGDEKPYTLIARTQIPLIAAWAMTIHKSQGMTLNRVIIDLKRSFEEGQEYVALSRARSLDGLKVESLGNGAGKRGNQQVREFLWNKFQLR